MWSQCGGSQVRRASVPPFLGVCARAADGTRTLPAAVRPPAIRSSRRVRAMKFLPWNLGGATLDLGERLVEYTESLVDVGVGMGERHVDLVDGLHHAATDALLVEERDTAAVGAERRPVVDDVTVGEDDVEHGRLAGHARRHAVLGRQLGEAVLEAIA